MPTTYFEMFIDLLGLFANNFIYQLYMFLFCLGSARYIINKVIK